MGREKALSFGRLITVKCKINDRIRKLLFGNHHSKLLTVTDKDHQWMLKLVGGSLKRNRNPLSPQHS